LALKIVLASKTGGHASKNCDHDQLFMPRNAMALHMMRKSSDMRRNSGTVTLKSLQMEWHN
jgi:hypothetical protein